MGKNKKIIAAVLALAVLLAGAFILYDRLGGSGETSHIGETDVNSEAGGEAEEQKTVAPDFTVFDADGNKVNLSDFSGKPVFIGFWATWCPNCKAGMPDIQKMYDKYKNDVNFIMINATDGQRETVEKAKAYIEENWYNMPFYFDSEMDASIAYAATGLPKAVLIDSEGYVKGHATGRLGAEDLERGIKMILE